MGQLEPIDDRTDRLHVARDHHQLFLANGWSSIDSDETGTGGLTTTTGTTSEILLPCLAGDCTTVGLQMRPFGDSGDVTLAVNGTELASQPATGAWRLYKWAVPSAALHVGLNSFVLRVRRPMCLGDVLVSKGPTGR